MIFIFIHFRRPQSSFWLFCHRVRGVPSCWVSACFRTPRLSLGHPGSLTSVHDLKCMRTQTAPLFNVPRGRRGTTTRVVHPYPCGTSRAGNRTRVVAWGVQSANHYTTGPAISLRIFLPLNIEKSIICEAWHVNHNTWSMIRDAWYVIRETWCMICDTWHAMHDTPTKFQVSATNTLEETFNRSQRGEIRSRAPRREKRNCSYEPHDRSTNI